MNYQQTLDYLYTQLPMYQRQGKSAFKKDLTNIFKLCRYLDNPQFKFKSIHIAGTNGKGSTAHILSAIYQNNGYKTGLYTSPHLLDFRERIKVNGKMVAKSFVKDFVKRIKPILEEIKPSFFEITVAMAFDYFASEEIEIAIIETGLGGRLDSTNVIIPELSIITSIAYDHMDMLGNSLSEIAFEKAGIIKTGKPVVVGLIPDEAQKVIDGIVQARQSMYYDAIHSPNRFTKQHLVETDLLGDYQQLNVKTALVASDVLQFQFALDDEKTLQALQKVKKLSGLLGRWQIISEKPMVIADVAHNQEGLGMAISELKKYEQEAFFILGFVKEKKLEDILPILPKNGQYVLVKPLIERGLDEHKACRAFTDFGLKARASSSIETAIKEWKIANSTKSKLLYIGGSNFIVADLLALINSKDISFD